VTVRLPLLIAAVALVGASLPGTASAQNQVMSGPNLVNNISGWNDSGMRFVANQNVDLVSFRYENQGNADIIWLLNGSRQIIQTVNVPAGNPNYFVNANWTLTAGQTYYLIVDNANNGRWVSYGAFPTSNTHISVQGVWNNSTNNFYTTWWFNFKDWTTGSANAAPTADPGPAGGGGYTGVEGSPVALDGSASTDPDGTVVTWEWDCETDGTVDVASSVGTGDTCIYPDDGTFTLTLTVTDDSGGTGSAATTVTVANVAPTITTTPPLTAVEGSAYTYAASVTDPGADTFTWSLAAGGPTAMTVSGAGVVDWTPTFADAQAGTANVVLDVLDDDGGADQQSWTITVDYLDADGDGMPDTWEGTYGLDPTVDDSGLDPDADGLSNLDEWLGGTDPTVYDGPAAPLQVSPIAGVEVDVLRPDLLVANAADPQGDVLTYDFEIYADAGAQTLLASVADVPEGATLLQQTAWNVPLDLAENTDAYWRARAADPFVAGAWTPLEGFFVNAVEEPPEVPVLQSPVAGETVAATPVQLAWSAGGPDPDRDAVTWDVSVFDEAGVVPVTSVADLVPGGGPQDTWDVDVALTEDARYQWTARAVDEHGNTSEWAAGEVFLYSLLDGAPGTPVWVAPLDGEQVDSVSPWLVCEEVSDPEGDEITYEFEAAPSADFMPPATVGGSVVGTGEGTASFALESIGAALEQNTWSFARVRSTDGNSTSPWTAITFFVRGDNDPPAVPVLLAPEDDYETATVRPGFVVAHAEDPEGDDVVYEIVVARDEALDEVVAAALELPPGAGEDGDELQTSWRPADELSADMFWSARAVDIHGAASEWAVPHTLKILPVITDDDRIGCQCGSFVPADTGPVGLGLLALAMIAGIRRRR